MSPIIKIDTNSLRSVTELKAVAGPYIITPL